MFVIIVSSFLHLYFTR